MKGTAQPRFPSRLARGRDPPAGRRRRLGLFAAASSLGLLAVLLVGWRVRPPPRAPDAAHRQPSHELQAPASRAPASARLGSPVPWPTARSSPVGDPLLAAIPADFDQVLTVDVNALLHAPLGRLWLACGKPRLREILGELRQAGLDPLVDLDRLAFARAGGRRALFASGFFARTRWDAAARALDLHAPVVGREAGGSGPLLFPAKICFLDCTDLDAGVWRERLLVLGLGGQETVSASMDLLEGRAGESFALPANLDPAEIVAVGDAEDLADALGWRSPPVWEWLQAMPTRVELRLEALGDLRGTARVTCEDPAAVADLRNLAAWALGEALAKAAADGDREREELFQHVTVVPGQGEFTVSLDLPAAVLERWIERCRKESRGVVR